MTTKRTVVVNPAVNKDGVTLHVEDELGRVIKSKPKGNVVRMTQHIARQINFGDLIVLQKKGAPKATGPDETATPQTEKED